MIDPKRVVELTRKTAEHLQKAGQPELSSGYAELAEYIASQSARIAELERVLAKRVEDYDDLAETHEAVVAERDEAIRVHKRAAMAFEVALAESEEETERLAHGLELATRQVAAMGAERDAVRKALEWMWSEQRAHVTIGARGHYVMPLSGSGASVEAALLQAHAESVEAALLAAAREGGA